VKIYKTYTNCCNAAKEYQLSIRTGKESAEACRKMTKITPFRRKVHFKLFQIIFFYPKPSLGKRLVAAIRAASYVSLWKCVAAFN